MIHNFATQFLMYKPVCELFFYVVFDETLRNGGICEIQRGFCVLSFLIFAINIFNILNLDFESADIFFALILKLFCCSPPSSRFLRSTARVYRHGCLGGGHRVRHVPVLHGAFWATLYFSLLLTHYLQCTYYLLLYFALCR